MNTRTQLFAVIALITCLNVNAQTYGDYNVLIDVTGNGGAHNSAIYFDDESWDPNQAPTYGWDGCCDANSFGVGTGNPEIYTQVVEPPAPPSNHRLSINGLPLLTEPIDVPLGFIPPALNEYTFSFTELYTLPAGVVVELEDLSLSVTQDLLVDSVYITWGAESDDEERFIVHFFPSNITGVSETSDGDHVRAYRTGEHLKVVGTDETALKQVRVYDLQGKLLAEDKTDRGTRGFKIDLTGIRTSVLILSVESDRGEWINLKLGI